MTVLLYIFFYAWLVGALLTASLFFVALRLLGGRQQFTDFFNIMQSQNYTINHIDWAIVIAIVFWPQMIASAILKNSIARANREATNNEA